MSGELLLHESLHHLRPDEHPERVDFLLGGYLFPSNALESFEAPEPLILVGDVLELNCGRATIGVVEVLVHILNGVALLVECLRHAIVVPIHIETVVFVQLPVLHLRGRVHLRFFETERISLGHRVAVLFVPINHALEVAVVRDLNDVEYLSALGSLRLA